MTVLDRIILFIMFNDIGTIYNNTLLLPLELNVCGAIIIISYQQKM